MPGPATCRSCHAEIAWAKVKASGKSMPVDFKRYDQDDATANVAVSRDSRGVLYARVLRDGEKPDVDERRTTSHFATCPNADTHRRRT